MTLGARPAPQVPGPGGPHDEVEHVVEVLTRLKSRLRDAFEFSLDPEEHGAAIVVAERIAAREDGA